MRQFVLALTVLLAASCNKKDATPVAPVAPMAVPLAQAPAPGALTGTVAETMDAASYTYLRLTTASGDVWAAIPTAKVTVGEQVTIASPMRMENFESKSLNRTFEVIMFGGGLATGAAAAAPMPPGHAPTPAVDLADVKVDRAPGGKTIAEIFAEKAALKDKPVTLRAKVVKYSSGIMGKNWLHLRDGSGTEGTDNDLTVTTNDVAALGDVVTVTGPVHLDRDIGAGYAYPVLIEDATIAK